MPPKKTTKRKGPTPTVSSTIVPTASSPATKATGTARTMPTPKPTKSNNERLLTSPAQHRYHTRSTGPVPTIAETGINDATTSGVHSLDESEASEESEAGEIAGTTHQAARVSDKRDDTPANSILIEDEVMNDDAVTNPTTALRALDPTDTNAVTRPTIRDASTVSLISHLVSLVPFATAIPSANARATRAITHARDQLPRLTRGRIISGGVIAWLAYYLYYHLLDRDGVPLYLSDRSWQAEVGHSMARLRDAFYGGTDGLQVDGGSDGKAGRGR
ncbi:uncharacterized protein BDZ99DRAFT_482881 [Mytilinidion resinicola]|uniref:Uncharacterized protein n=1 Tax=Mytilinidion resinicola TaxID=574789 RepID=A0A6A6Y1S1_9PEZI|nr:uncharacterized protein BDZ99DRAFT_482881 [Mytilinidion resinicola]KAF2802463.1 hypothetical protein BDZ99DRAFT_482881 [Mytilinidion resinicola]